MKVQIIELRKWLAVMLQANQVLIELDPKVHSQANHRDVPCIRDSTKALVVCEAISA